MNPPLIQAIMLNRRNNAQRLINNGVNVNQTSKDVTPLMWAAMMGRLDIARMLIRAGAKINTRHPKSRWTALRFAIKHNHPEVARLLIKLGAEVNRNMLSNPMVENALRQREPLEAVVRRAENSFRRRTAERVLLSPAVFGKTILNQNVIREIAKHMRSVKRH